MRLLSRILFAITVVAVSLVSGVTAHATTNDSTTTTTPTAGSTTVADPNTPTSTVVPAPTAAEVASQYPTRALRFPPYSRLNPPQIPIKSGNGRRVIYKNSLQWVWVVDAQNNVVRAMPVSGRRGVPTPGDYRVRFALGPAGGNIGFHAIPTKDDKALQTEEQLGTFQGSGCIRMSPSDAKFIFNFAKPGTKVVVLP
ncbi:MAG: hypothetical protein RI976_1220 [Actinomycetota bacterium]